MKKITSLLLTGLILLNINSCSKSELVLYDTNRKDMLNIWFGNLNQTPASTTHNFSHFASERTAFTFSYRITGTLTDYPRTFTLEVATDTGDFNKVSFEIGEFTIPAGEFQGTGTFYILNNVDTNTFADSIGGYVELRLKPSETFNDGTIQRSRLRITLRNGLIKPTDWDVPYNSSFYYPLSRFFGSYSRVKHSLIIEVTGMPTFKVWITGTPPQEPVGGEPVISSILARNFQDLVRRRLSEINQERVAQGLGLLTDEFGDIVVIP